MLKDGKEVCCMCGADWPTCDCPGRSHCIGIDPGVRGGIAIITANGSVELHKMPGTPLDLYELLVAYPTAIAILERVHSMPKQGVSSTFKFGVNYGWCQMALAASGIRWEEVTPQKWQKEFSLILPKLTKTEKKNAHKSRAQQLFPRIKITHAIADALLLAEYCRRK